MNVSDNYQIYLSSLQEFTLNPLDWIKKTVAVKGVIISVPQKDAYSFSGKSIHTKDENLKKLFSEICNSALMGNTPLASSPYCLDNPSGGFDTNTG